MHGSLRDLALTGIVFLIAVLADNQFDFGPIHYNYPPLAAVHFFRNFNSRAYHAFSQQATFSTRLFHAP
jgi:hypothetical protein